MKKLFCHIMVAVCFTPLAYALEVENHEDLNVYIASHNLGPINFSLETCLYNGETHL